MKIMTKPLTSGRQKLYMLAIKRELWTSPSNYLNILRCSYVIYIAVIIISSLRLCKLGKFVGQELPVVGGIALASVLDVVPIYYITVLYRDACPWFYHQLLYTIRNTTKRYLLIVEAVQKWTESVA